MYAALAGLGRALGSGAAKLGSGAGRMMGKAGNSMGRVMGNSANGMSGGMTNMINGGPQMFSGRATSGVPAFMPGGSGPGSTGGSYFQGGSQLPPIAPSSPAGAPAPIPGSQSSQMDPMQQMAIMGMMNQGQNIGSNNRPPIQPMNNQMAVAPIYANPNDDILKKNQLLSQVFANMGNRQRRA